MKKLLLFVLSATLILSFGCATKTYVKEQVAPLKDCCDKADKAAKKCEKAFDLHQKK
jgi:hypothetical protein